MGCKKTLTLAIKHLTSLHLSTFNIQAQLHVSQYYILNDSFGRVALIFAFLSAPEQMTRSHGSTHRRPHSSLCQLWENRVTLMLKSLCKYSFD